MILKLIPISRVDTAVHQLPEPDMVVDPRPNAMDAFFEFHFKFTVHGKTVNVTRIRSEDDELKQPGWPFALRFRVYSRNEFHFPFDSTMYFYNGVRNERAPGETTEAIVKDGLEMIDHGAFLKCTELTKVTIPNSIRIIEDSAFSCCISLRSIRLPPRLEFIGSAAFRACAFQSLYLPPTLRQIDDMAFCFCQALRFMNFPDGLVLGAIEQRIVYMCESLVTDNITEETPHKEVVQWLRNRYSRFHDLCWDPSVTAGRIQMYMQRHHDDEGRARTKDRPQLTALHLLAANPSVNGEMINSYLQLAPDVAVIQDDIGQTPFHTLCSVPCFSNGSGAAIAAFLTCAEGKKAAVMKDKEGRTPFDCLCEKGFDELLFLEDKSFAGLIMWWCEHLGINLFGAEELRKISEDDNKIEDSNKKDDKCPSSSGAGNFTRSSLFMCISALIVAWSMMYFRSDNSEGMFSLE